MAKFAAGFSLTQRLKPSSHLGEEALRDRLDFQTRVPPTRFNGFYVPRHRYHVPREARASSNAMLFGEKIEEFHVGMRNIRRINVNIAEN